MEEVAYEIKDGADVIVGAEEVIQLPSLNWEGFPWSTGWFRFIPEMLAVARRS